MAEKETLGIQYSVAPPLMDGVLFMHGGYAGGDHRHSNSAEIDSVAQVRLWPDPLHSRTQTIGSYPLHLWMRKQRGELVGSMRLSSPRVSEPREVQWCRLSQRLAGGFQGIRQVRDW
jgi:hypothetical protein